MKFKNIVLTTFSLIIFSVSHHALALKIDNNNSYVSLVSTKILADGTSSVSEVFTFSSLAGSVSDDGAATVTLELGSVETGIDIRNERMGKFLFETDRYPEAKITAQIPDTALATGGRMIDLDITVDMRGKQMMYTVPVVVTSDKAQVLVAASKPLLVDANSFGLQGGLGKLGELAGLMHIPSTVPVMFNLVFER